MRDYESLKYLLLVQDLEKLKKQLGLNCAEHDKVKMVYFDEQLAI